MKASLAVLLLASLALSATAARVPGSKSSFEDIMSALRVKAAANGDDVDKRRKDESAYLVIRFRVPASLHDDFVDEWKDLEEDAQDDKGVVVYDLKKTISDNLYFYHYSEWESGEDLYAHFTDKAFSKFRDWADDHDIEWEVVPIKSVVNTDQEHRDSRKRADGQPPVDKRRKDQDLAHVLIKYEVPPSAQDDFIDAWQDVAEDTYKEDDNRIYALRKIATSNTEFYAYGTWEDYESYRDHFESKHVREFRETIGDQGVVWFLQPLEKIGSQKE